MFGRAPGQFRLLIVLINALGNKIISNIEFRVIHNWMGARRILVQGRRRIYYGYHRHPVPYTVVSALSLVTYYELSLCKFSVYSWLLLRYFDLDFIWVHDLKEFSNGF